MKKYPKLSDLPELNRQHLAWRIDRYTGVGVITACKIARIEINDWPVNEVFKQCGMTEHKAKIHATKVINFKAHIPAGVRVK